MIQDFVTSEKFSILKSMGSLPHFFTVTKTHQNDLGFLQLSNSKYDFELAKRENVIQDPLQQGL